MGKKEHLYSVTGSNKPLQSGYCQIKYSLQTSNLMPGLSYTEKHLQAYMATSMSIFTPILCGNSGSEAKHVFATERMDVTYGKHIHRVICNSEK